jgi:hypothetical protein
MFLKMDVAFFHVKNPLQNVKSLQKNVLKCPSKSGIHGRNVLSQNVKSLQLDGKDPQEDGMYLQ